MPPAGQRPPCLLVNLSLFLQTRKFGWLVRIVFYPAVIAGISVTDFEFHYFSITSSCFSMAVSLLRFYIYDILLKWLANADSID